MGKKEFGEVPAGVKKVYDTANSYFTNQAIVYRVEPKKISFIDYSKGFGHRDIVEF